MRKWIDFFYALLCITAFAVVIGAGIAYAPKEWNHENGLEHYLPEARALSTSDRLPATAR